MKCPLYKININIYLFAPLHLCGCAARFFFALSHTLAFWCDFCAASLHIRPDRDFILRRLVAGLCGAVDGGV